MSGQRSTNRKSRKKAATEAEQHGNTSVLPVRRKFSNSATASAPNAEYKFLQLNEGAYKPTDSAARKLIRSHVMRNYFQEKKTQSEDTSLANSASTVIAKNNLKGRWRLGKQSATADGKQVDESKATKHNKLLQEHDDRLPQAGANKYPLLHAEHPFVLSSNGSDSDGSPLNTPPLEIFQVNVRDPFDSMPIATSNPRTNRLMHFCKSDDPCVRRISVESGHARHLALCSSAAAHSPSPPTELVFFVLIG